MVAPSTQTVLSQWNWAPSIVLGIAALIGGYWYLTGPVRHRLGLGAPPTPKQLMWFALSVLTLIVALLSPLDTIGDQYLFSAHMSQHLLLATLWPPMILMALPAWLIRPIYSRPFWTSLIGFLTFPAVAILAFNLDVYAWHFPAFYNATLSSDIVHIAEHLSFMGFGLLLWWPVLCPLRARRLSYPFQILYLLVAGMLMMVLGILFTFATAPFYHPYEIAPRLWGISASADQQVGGLIMWYPGNIPYAIAMVAAFYRWFDGEEMSPADGPRTSSPTTIGPPIS